MFSTKTDEHMKVVDDFLNPILQEALRKKERRVREEKTVDNPEDGAVTLLDHLVQSTSGEHLQWLCCLSTYDSRNLTLRPDHSS